MTLREVMNRVLRATGQAQIPCEVSLIEDSNQLLILEYLNQFKEEIESAHNWRSMKQTWTTTVPAALGVATVGSPNGTVSAKSRLMRVHDARFGRLLPVCYDITNAAQPFRLWEQDLALIYDQLHADGGVMSQNAATFSLDSNTADKLFVRLFPVPNVDRVVTMTLFVPQPYLDVSDLDTDIWIPTRALLIGTIWYVLEERGEELGQSSMFTEERYRTALDDEIASDLAAMGEPELVPV